MFLGLNPAQQGYGSKLVVLCMAVTGKWQVAIIAFVSVMIMAARMERGNHTGYMYLVIHTIYSADRVVLYYIHIDVWIGS